MRVLGVVWRRMGGCLLSCCWLGMDAAAADPPALDMEASNRENGPCACCFRFGTRMSAAQTAPFAWTC